jgi:glycosyltransferase involved in cell wall biosynthesis
MTAGAGQDQLGAVRLPPPAVSVICTARNAASTIGHTIRSIQAQDCQSWEMIIVDDGSSDDTISVVRTFARADPRIRLVVTEGIGRGRALNRALAETQADLVANIDADDESHPARLRLQLGAMARHPEFDVLCTGRFLVSGLGPAEWPEDVESLPLKVVAITSRLVLENPVDHPSVLMRKSVVLAVGGYSHDRKSHFDYDLWVRLAATGCMLGKLEVPLNAKRIHQGQSFEHRHRIGYVVSSVRIQIRAIRSLDGGAVPFMVIPLRVVWNLLPAAWRVYLTRAGVKEA